MLGARLALLLDFVDFADLEDLALFASQLAWELLLFSLKLPDTLRPGVSGVLPAELLVMLVRLLRPLLLPLVPVLVVLWDFVETELSYFKPRDMVASFSTGCCRAEESESGMYRGSALGTTSAPELAVRLLVPWVRVLSTWESRVFGGCGMWLEKRSIRLPSSKSSFSSSRKPGSLPATSTRTSWSSPCASGVCGEGSGEPCDAVGEAKLAYVRVGEGYGSRGGKVRDGLSLEPFSELRLALS
jgi:hypothetical protein